MNTCEQYPVIRIRGTAQKNFDDDIVTEFPLTIFVNENEFVTVICTPEYLLELAVGHLYSERVIDGAQDIITSKIDEGRNTVRFSISERKYPVTGVRLRRYITPGCIYYTALNTGVKKIESDVHVSSGQLLELVRCAHKESVLYKKTGCVHSAALCRSNGILFLREDIGRHNAIDKLVGHCLLNNIAMEDTILLTSGRVSSAVMVKIINARIPVIVSSSAPTSESIKLAEKFGITLAGFARGKRINIYTNYWRVDDIQEYR
jgi:FdhD protein